MFENDRSRHNTMAGQKQTVCVEDIVEYPTELGSRCMLLQYLGLNAHWNTQEELLKALTESAQNTELLETCKQSSRCQAFWEKYQKGETPFLDCDPIRLYEYDGKYWVSEGKHRVCMAKRTGVKNIEAYVFGYPTDDHLMLPNEGSCGDYSFRHSLTKGKHSNVEGQVAVLWVNTPHSELLHEFDFDPTAITQRQDTHGEWETILPGVSYRVSCTEQKCGLFWSGRRVIVETEVRILPEHLNTRIWLLSANAADVLGWQRPSLPQMETLYRFGCWRRHHLKKCVNYSPFSRQVPRPL